MKAGEAAKVEAEEGQPLRTSQPSSWRLRWKKMRVNWSLKWLGWKERLSGWSAKSLNWLKGLGSRSAKWFNWTEIRSNRTALYVVAALIVLLISVPVIVWQTGRTPAKETETVPLPTVVATPEVAQKAEPPVKAKKAEAPRGKPEEEQRPLRSGLRRSEKSRNGDACGEACLHPPQFRSVSRPGGKSMWTAIRRGYHPP